MADEDRSGISVPATGMALLEQMQHWTRIVGHAQQLMLERATDMAGQAAGDAAVPPPLQKIAEIQADHAREGMAAWQRFLDRASGAAPAPEADKARPDRRFAAAAWRDNPLFDLIRQSYLLSADTLMRLTDAVDGIDAKQKEKLRFATRSLTDALSPANFPLTNPQVLETIIATGGENLVKGMQNMLADMDRGQLTHTDGSAFELGRNIATTPGKVIHETPLYQLIQYSPTTPEVLETPLVIFPPWINRFYILDLAPEKSFVKWAVDQGLSVFMVSWKSADASMADVDWDDYVMAQVDAIDTVRDLLDVGGVHAIGYCVAGTTLASTLAWLTARGRAEIVRSVTFFTAQVDFAEAGDLTLFVDDEQLALIDSLVTDGYLDGRYMAATFNLLRGNDLIWNYVVNNYLLGKDYPPFDLLYWNGDTTNLPAKWHRAYLTRCYRDNALVRPGGISVAGTPIDLRTIATPAYVQAGVEDHIAPARSVWKLTRALAGPVRFLLAGSGHVAGVVNPPAARKYQYWTADGDVPSLDAFRAAAHEIKGSWWPDWIEWIRARDAAVVPVRKARKPGKGKRPALEDAPGRYVKTR
jgi:polyhydroxyalkanoate synthase